MKSDLELVEQVRAGSHEAFSELVRRPQKSLLRLCMRLVGSLEVAEDVVQESFYKAYRKINFFEGRASFKSWLFQIGVNTAKNKLRLYKRETVDIENIHAAVSAVAEKDLVQEDIRVILKKEVDKLPDRQRMAIVLRIYEDLSFKEIAAIMECPYDTAKANYRHGLMKIKASLGEDNLLAQWDEPADEVTEVETTSLELEQ
jgi:RNA polymerase sigma-70 factor (ECF subfamily)